VGRDELCDYSTLTELRRLQEPPTVGIIPQFVRKMRRSAAPWRTFGVKAWLISDSLVRIGSGNHFFKELKDNSTMLSASCSAAAPTA
jgi:hypothetical protein